MKNILVTGAGGFIGFNLCNYLATRGHSVAGIDLHYPEDVSREHHGSFQRVLSDFRNWEVLKKHLSGVDVIFHLASAHLQISLDHDEYWNINVHSLRPFLKLALNAGVQRFIHVSSVGVYGNLTKLPASENTACQPQSIYGETKLAGEAEVRKFNEETGFPLLIIRPAWVYGSYCPRTQKIFNALRKGRFIMIGNGNNLRHPLYISDMLEAFRIAMTTDSTSGDLFLIGGQKAITTNELVKGFCTVMGFAAPKIRLPFWLGRTMAWGIEALCGLAKIEPPISRRTLEFFDTNNAFDITKSKRILGFEPKFSFEEGLRNCSEWLKRNS